MSMYGNNKFKAMYGTNKVKAIMYGTNKVWSGASVVSYYDGTTLIGTEEVDEGLDVLHPTFDMSKDGYTHVGWTYSDERVTSLVATGEPMNVTAIYLPNTYVAYTRKTDRVETFRDTKYIISGNLDVSVTSSWNGTSTSYSTVDFGDYQNCVFIYSVRRYGGGFGWYEIVNDTNYTIYSSTSGWDNDTVNAVNGTNRFWAGISSSGTSETIQVYVTKATLSNPKAWV